MKAVFAHDHFLYTGIDQQVYSEVGFDYPMWERYLKNFDQLTIASRLVEDPQLRSPNAKLRSSGDRVQFVSLPNLSNPRTRLTAMPIARRRMREVLQAADAVIVRLPSEVGLLAIKEAQAMNIPWAVEVVGDAWGAYWNYQTLAGRLYAPVAYMRHRKWIRRAKYAIYVTKHYLQKRYPSTGVVEHASNVQLTLDHTFDIRKRIELLKSYEGGALRVGLIGYLNDYKGIDTAIEALKRVLEQIPQCELHIVGKGDTEKYRQLAESMGIGNRVIFHGVLLPQALMEWLHGLDLYIQPSRTEGLPRALIEAMSTGCPAIGSSAGGIPELLDHEALHRPGDEKGLAERMLHALTNIDWRLQQALVVIQRAAEYDINRLEARRDGFWRSFAEYAQREKEGHL
ncbi:MAG: glycosyltransferase family 4 protein [Candidatus Cohnella colombiensis]|uniref:Glycosyltransferase family 4 protein n=1 Tax=Candidatus Cohnella colombiensis TaxID=3121368 RepID=A0AA95EVF5_9BACL|nr:MAG: glycosyltransferase family 4 protein [Cohnella sp.]